MKVRKFISQFLDEKIKKSYIGCINFISSFYSFFKFKNKYALYVEFPSGIIKKIIISDSIYFIKPLKFTRSKNYEFLSLQISENKILNILTSKIKIAYNIIDVNSEFYNIFVNKKCEPLLIEEDNYLTIVSFDETKYYSSIIDINGLNITIRDYNSFDYNDGLLYSIMSYNNLIPFVVISSDKYFISNSLNYNRFILDSSISINDIKNMILSVSADENVVTSGQNQILVNSNNKYFFIKCNDNKIEVFSNTNKYALLQEYIKIKYGFDSVIGIFDDNFEILNASFSKESVFFSEAKEEMRLPDFFDYYLL